MIYGSHGMLNKPINNAYSIKERFEITGRGVVIVIDEVTNRVPGKAYCVEVTGIDGQKIIAQAFKELLLRRHQVPIEYEAYVVKDVHAQDISDESVICFL